MKIALVGFSFSGKTTVGAILAKKLKCEFIDSDEAITKKYGDISAIFSLRGEEYFRDIEERIINDIVQNKNDFVLSTGGGAVLNKKTSAMLTKYTKTIWLKTSLENTIKRDTKKDDHPMLAGKERDKAIRELYNKRLNLYSFADITVDTNEKTAIETADEILKLINSD